MQGSASDAEVQADIPEPENEEPQLKIRANERIKLHPKVPIEPTAYGKGKNFSRPWILQDGRKPPGIGSEMRDSYKIPKKAPHSEGIRKRMLTDFYWEQMLDEVIEELATSQPVVEYCTEQNANYVKENFTPRDLSVATDKNASTQNANRQVVSDVLLHIGHTSYILSTHCMGQDRAPSPFTVKISRKPALEKYWKSSEGANISPDPWKKGLMTAGCCNSEFS